MCDLFLVYTAFNAYVILYFDGNFSEKFDYVAMHFKYLFYAFGLLYTLCFN